MSTLLGLATVVAVLGLVAVLVLSRPNGGANLGQGLLLLSAGTLPWSAVQFGGIPAGDFFLAASIPPLLLAAVRTRLHLPATVWGPAALVALSAVLTSLMPPSASYLTSRVSLQQTYFRSIGIVARSTDNLASVLKYEVAILVLPIVFVLACVHDPRFVRKIGAAWSLGIVISCAIAYTDHIGISAISNGLIGYVSSSGREAGLTPQANNVGVEATMALPVLLFLFSSPRGRVRFAASLGIAVCLLGVFVSGSRGAAVGVPAALVLTVSLSSAAALRRWTRRLVLFGGVVLSAVLLSPAGEQLLVGLRLAGSPDAVNQSDVSRTGARVQGVADFLHSPINGIGWGYASNAHIVGLQVLAAGGLVAALAVLWLVGRTLQIGWIYIRPNDPYGGVLLASVLTWVVVGIVENQLTDQWVWVPVASILAMAAERKVAQDRADETKVDETKADGTKAGAAAKPLGRVPAGPVRPPAGRRYDVTV